MSFVMFSVVKNAKSKRKFKLSFERFKRLCLDCYMEIRANVDIFKTMLNMMLCSGIPELNKNSISKFGLN
jgi:hypothetical protein